MHINKENVDYLLRLRNLRYRQTPNNLKRVKAHANGVNNLLQFLIVSVNFADFQITRIKSGRSVYVLSLCRYVFIRFSLFLFVYIQWAFTRGTDA